VRIGVHTGTPYVTEDGYVGADVHRAARIAAAGHGGQVLLSAATASLLGTERLRDLGEHRLKDLSAPERIYQLSEHQFPPLNTLYQTNLPVPASSFLGREHELQEVGDLLVRDDVRLLTLTGPGGTGKTRLALQAAGTAADAFPGGVWWVPLAPLRDPSLLLPAVAHAVAVEEEAARPLAETLAAALRGTRSLLVLDNAEHLLPDAALTIAAVREMDGPVLLVTSRERLQLQGEHVYSVPTLDDREGVELFVARTLALDATFEPKGALGELCSRLDNLPLALELAAARTTLFTPEQLLERLSKRLDLLKAGRDADPRQQTLRATIGWSYDLLDSSERRLFRGLSVFAGGCTFDTAEEVCGAEPETLQSLIDKSLVRRRDDGTAPRYWMLETIREYASEEVEREGEALELQRRHAEWIARLAADLGAALEENVERPQLARLDAEYANMTAALAFASERDPDLTAKIVAPVRWWWTARGRYSELERWLEPLLGRDLSPQARAQVLAARMSIALHRDDSARLRACGEALLPLSRSLGIDRLACSALTALGYAAFMDGDVEEGRARVLEAIDIARTVLPRRVAGYLGSLGWALRAAGELSEARAVLEEALDRARSEGSSYGLPLLLAQRANLSLDEREFENALALYREALGLAEEWKNGRLIAICLSGISGALAGLGRFDDATRLSAAATALSEKLSLWNSDQEEDERSVELRDRLGAARYETLVVEGRSLRDEEAVALALSAALHNGIEQD
jgi:predicted ATPase